MTLLLVGLGVAVLVGGLCAPVRSITPRSSTSTGHDAFVAIVLAFSVALALATGVEPRSSAIARLGRWR